MAVNPYWVSVIQNEEETFLTDRFPLRLIEVRSLLGNTKDNSTSFVGQDGEIVYPPTYEAFSLEVDFRLKAIDNYDYHLLVGELKSLLCQEAPYFVRHEKLPARKYAVDRCEISPTRKSANLADLTLTFHCFKGVSESLYTSTTAFTYEEEAWGVGLNIPEGEDIQYVFEGEAIFNVYNPSDMRINPRFHPLSIALTCDSVTGQNVRIYNRTNGTLFELKKPIKKADVLLLDGVYPYLNDARCGIDTNHGLITLERGWNRVQIINATNTTIAFDFPFYYR
ncbi:phage tail domain-containing protein [Listeria kieliensis]